VIKAVAGTTAFGDLKDESFQQPMITYGNARQVDLGKVVSRGLAAPHVTNNAGPSMTAEDHCILTVLEPTERATFLNKSIQSRGLSASPAVPEEPKPSSSTGGGGTR